MAVKQELQGQSVLKGIKQAKQASPSPYTHGLESIYAIETIDLKTLRTLKSSVEEPKASISRASDTWTEPQLTLDLGDHHRGWIESFVLREPIHVLALSSHAEQCLLKQGKKSLQDIIGINFNDFVFFKGMGQGHIDEVNQKLKKYLEGRSLHRCSRFDAASLLRSISHDLDIKKLHVALMPYDLHDLFPLPLSCRGEVMRLDASQKSAWEEEIKLTLKHHPAIKEGFKQVFNAFLYLWILRRGGIATKEEMEERLLKTSVQPSITEKLLLALPSLFSFNLFSDIFSLHSLSGDLFALDSSILQDIHLIEKCALTYFYKGSVRYEMKLLISLLARELAKKWITISQKLIEKILLLSPQFLVYKSSSRRLEVRLA